MNRRDFLTATGFSLAGAALWGCATQDQPVLGPQAAGDAQAAIPTAAGATRSSAVALVSHDAADLAQHWSTAALPARSLRATGPATALSTSAPVGGTIVGVTGLAAAHGALTAYWVHAKHNLPFGLWAALVQGDELAATALVRHKVVAPAGQIRLQWQLGSEPKREVVFGADAPLTRGLYAVALQPEAGDASPVLWVCLDATAAPLRGSWSS